MPAEVVFNGSISSNAAGTLRACSFTITPSASRINLASVASAGEVYLAGDKVETFLMDRGEIVLSNLLISTRGELAGDIFIIGGRLVARSRSIAICYPTAAAQVQLKIALCFSAEQPIRHYLSSFIVRRSPDFSLTSSSPDTLDIALSSIDTHLFKKSCRDTQEG